MILTVKGNNGVSILRNVLPKAILPLLGLGKQILRVFPLDCQIIANSWKWRNLSFKLSNKEEIRIMGLMKCKPINCTFNFILLKWTERFSYLCLPRHRDQINWVNHLSHIYLKACFGDTIKLDCHSDPLHTFSF